MNRNRNDNIVEEKWCPVIFSKSQKRTFEMTGFVKIQAISKDNNSDVSAHALTNEASNFAALIISWN